MLITALLVGSLRPTASVQAQTNWYDPDWQYRRPVTVSNTGATSLTDYQVLITLDATFDFSRAESDGADIRITTDDGATLLPFWIETWNATAEEARLWVKVPSLVVGDSTLYLYYGNAGAPSIGDGHSTFIFFDDFEGFNPYSMNADTPLTTPTYDGSGQVVHPDVVHIPSGWNGYEYWMAMTPYPNSNDQYENPSILVSHDGIMWEEPPGITNPLVPAAADHNADTDMVLANDTLMLYYAEYTGRTSSDFTHFNVLTSTNGIDWNGPEHVISIPFPDGYGLSPTVLYEAGTFYMWYVRNAGCAAGTSTVYLRTSTDGLSWGPEQIVSLPHADQVVWHPDVQKTGSTYVMLYAAYPNGSTCNSTRLYYAESTDRINWTATETPILTPNPSGWDSTNIYRSTFLVNDTYLRIWYSARSGSQWHVGYTEGERDAFLGAQTQQWDAVLGTMSATTDHPRTGSYGLRQVGGSTYPQLQKNVSDRISFNAWLYDDLNTTGSYLAIARVWDSGNATYSEHAIGTGLYTGASTSHHVYHTEGWSYTPTNVPRTAGWHRLTINVKDTTSDLYVDDTQVSSLDVLDENDISRVSIEGYQAGVGLR